MRAANALRRVLAGSLFASCGASVACALVGALATPASADGNLHVAGHIRVAVEKLTLADAGAIVVFLEPIAGRSTGPQAPLPPASVRQKGARFDPTFIAVAIGQAVDMPNDDVIFHNVFSYSEPNDFDLGMYASGQSRSLRFEHAGLVRIYCSIHESMDGLIFVAPSRWFTRPGPDGRYSIGDVEPGRYRLHVWSERLPERILPIDLEENRSREIDLELGIRVE